MPCRSCGLTLFPGGYKSATGLQQKGCPIRLKELNNAQKPAPTKLKGSQVARENYIRRRVAVIKQIKDCLPKDKRLKNGECNETYAYGPVFGIARGPKFGGKDASKGCSGGGCNNIYYANGGSGSDVVQWKRLYGGSRTLFSTKSCKYGCCGQVGPEGKGVNKGCRCYGNGKSNLRYKTTNGISLQVGDALWPAPGQGYPTMPNLYDGIIVAVTPAPAPSPTIGQFRIKTLSQNSVMGKIMDVASGPSLPPSEPVLNIFRRNKFTNQIHIVGQMDTYGIAPGNVGRVDEAC